MSQQPAHHTIPTRNGRYGDEGHYEGAAMLVMGSRTLNVGGWRAEGVGRVEYKGPMVPGPVAYAYLRASVLADTHHEDDTPRIHVADGDTLDIAGTTYRIRRVDHYGNVALDRL